MVAAGARVSHLGAEAKNPVMRPSGFKHCTDFECYKVNVGYENILLSSMKSQKYLIREQGIMAIVVTVKEIEPFWQS